MISISLILFIASGSLITLILVVRGFQTRKELRRDRLATDLDHSIYTKMHNVRVLLLKIAHLDKETIRRIAREAARVLLVIVAYFWVLVSDFIQKLLRLVQGGTVPETRGGASFFLKEVGHFKKEVINRG